MKTDCRHGEDTAAFLAGEFAPGERADFERHLAGCVECRAAVAATRRVLGKLCAAPEIEPSHNLAPLVFAKLREKRLACWPRMAAAAAVLVAVIGGALALRGSREIATTTASAERAIEWLSRVQQSDGSWDPERWGGQKMYAPALTALPLLALATANEATPARADAIARAAASLLRQQNADGGFGPDFSGAPYNHSIATLALLRTWQRQPAAVSRAALDRAVAVLANPQTAAGGWGYRRSPRPDRSITQWHIQALDLAAQLGWENARPVLARGLAWLGARGETLADAQEPPDSTSAILARASAHPTRTGALDFYQAYFASAALRDDRAVEAPVRLASLQRTIMRQQVAEGNERGSWLPNDQWGRAGGRLYATALASLALCAGAR